jgi:hypothetical protein
MRSSGTPWELSETVSRSGHLVARMRRRRSSSSDCATLMRNGEMDSFGMGGLASDMLSPLSAVSATPEAAVPASMVRSGELGLLTFRQVSHTVTEEATDLVERIQRITVGHSSGSLVASDPEGPDPQLMINTPQPATLLTHAHLRRAAKPYFVLSTPLPFSG